MRLVFSAGGTGGHIFPALAVADEIKERFPKAEILFIGAKGKMEMERIPKAGYAIKGLWISGLLGKSLATKLMTLIKLIHSILKSYFILKKYKPNAAIGFGGFASGPALLTASWMGIPTLLQEQNSYPGLTNRLLGKRANRICTAYEIANEYFPQDKVVLHGNPVRRSLRLSSELEKEALEHFGLVQGKKTILLLGGSLGARTFNRAMVRLKSEIEAEVNEIQFIWQMGKLYADHFSQSETAQLANVIALPFLDRMDLAYQLSDLVVARAGALTISELALLGKAALLVPSPNVSEDHQTKNAMALVKREAAAILNDSECELLLIAKIKEVIGDRGKMDLMRGNISELSKPNATSNIADEVLNLIKHSRG